MSKNPINVANYNSKTLQGVVISSGKMHKTVVIKVDRKVTHPVYKKTMNKFSKYYVHDEDNQCNEGDLVEIKESRPISKTKSWVLYKLIKKAIVEKIS